MLLALEQLALPPPSTELLLLLSPPGSSASESLSDELSCFRFFVAFLSLPLLFVFFSFFLLFALASFFDAFPFFFFFFVPFLLGFRCFLPVSSAFFARFSCLRFSFCSN